MSLTYVPNVCPTNVFKAISSNIGGFDPYFQGGAGQRRGGASLKIQGSASLYMQVIKGAASLYMQVIKGAASLYMQVIKRAAGGRKGAASLYMQVINGAASLYMQVIKGAAQVRVRSDVTR
jgi:tartrate dehydratase beta subunit/fumarate hydratase class I family protein